MTTRTNKSTKENGFTLVEMLVVAPIVILVIGTLVAAIVTVTGSSMTQMNGDMLTYNLNKAISQIRTDSKITNNFLATNSVADSSTYTNVGDSSGNMLILQTYTTTTSPDEDDLQFVYTASSPNPCSSSLSVQNTPMYANIIYFINNNTLWRRTIMPANYSTNSCQTPWQQPSCASGTSGNNCKVNDQDIIDNISSFSITYYNHSSITALTTAIDQNSSNSIRQVSLSTANTAVVSISASSSISGNTITKSTTARLVLPNL